MPQTETRNAVAVIRLDTAERIADARASEDGREGISAFLEKRRPRWTLG